MDKNELTEVQDETPMPADERGEAAELAKPRTGGAHVADVAGRVALSAVLATSLATALSEPPNTDLMALPEPTPIVQVYDPYVDDGLPLEDEDDEGEESRWKRLLKILRYLAVALLIGGAVAFGALKGCAGCTATALLPDDPPQEEQAQESEQEQEQQA